MLTVKVWEGIIRLKIRIQLLVSEIHYCSAAEEALDLEHAISP